MPAPSDADAPQPRRPPATAAIAAIAATAAPDVTGAHGHRFAAVDVGSNSVHLLVAAVIGDRIESLADESVFLGLGARVERDRSVGDLTQDLVAALAIYADRARGLGAEGIAFVGTEPLRRAVDAARVVAMVRAGTSVPLDVLDHDEEGLLTFLGVTAGVLPTGDLAVVDVGGGSSELVLAGPSGPIRAAAIPLGCARLTRQIGAADPPTAADRDALRAIARTAAATLPDAAPLELVAVGGTASNLVKVLPVAGRDRILTSRRLAAALKTLAAEPAAAVAPRFGISATRARSLSAGAIILGEVMTRYGLDRARAEEAGIREGLVIALARGGAGWRDRLTRLTRGWRG